MPGETTDALMARLKREVQAASDEAGEWEEQLRQHREARPDQPDDEWLRIEQDLEASHQEALRQLNNANEHHARLAMEKAAADKADPLSPEAEAAINKAATEPDFGNFRVPEIEEPTEVMYQADPDPLTVGDLSGGGGWRSHPLLVGAGAIALVAVIGMGIGLAMGGNDGPSTPTFAPTPAPTDSPYPTQPAPTATEAAPTATPYPTQPAPTDTPSAQYFIGPLQVKRDPGSTTTLYTLTAMGLPSDASITWSLSAPCGSLAPAQFSAFAIWQQSPTKACPPGAAGPFAGEVTVTITTPRGSISFSASSETGTVGEATAIP
jgi:hypothetical protein